MLFSRRRFLIGLGAVAAAPAIVWARSLMPIKVMRPLSITAYVDAAATAEDIAINPHLFRTLREAVSFVDRQQALSSEINVAPGVYTENITMPPGEHTLVGAGHGWCNIVSRNRVAPILNVRRA